MGEWVTLPSVKQLVNAPADRCFSIFTCDGYTRWPEWSPWLTEVTTEPGEEEAISRWFLTAKGFGISWLARNAEVEEGKLIRWESISGVRQGGSCSFTAIAPQSTELCLELRFETPAAIALLFSGPWLREYVKGRLQADMERFAVIAEREHREAQGDQDDGPSDPGIDEPASQDAVRKPLRQRLSRLRDRFRRSE